MLTALIVLLAVVALAALHARLETTRLEAAFAPMGPLVDVPGGPIHLAERGPEGGSVVVLIHGASGNLRDPLLSIGGRLSARHRVIAVDRPGHGLSGRTPGPESAAPDHQARVIADALRARGVEGATIVGISLGASTAAAMALVAPDLVRGLALVTPATHPWGGSGISWHNHLVAKVPVLGPAFAATVPMLVGRLIMGPALVGVFKPNPVPQRYADTIGAALVLRPSSFRANAEDVAFAEENFARLAPRYREIAVPTVVVEGADDPIVWNHVHAASLVREIGGARLVTIPGVGHMPHWVVPDAAVAAIESVIDPAYSPIS